MRVETGYLCYCIAMADIRTIIDAVCEQNGLTRDHKIRNFKTVVFKFESSEFEDVWIDLIPPGSFTREILWTMRSPHPDAEDGCVFTQVPEYDILRVVHGEISRQLSLRAIEEMTR